jgi:hypothetical protein
MKETSKQGRRSKREKRKPRNKQEASKKKQGKQANQKARKQTLPHVLGFGRYPLSHKPSHPSKREAKSKI